jgi:FKBP-type peptidyl-prolyl cis-trans isomerase.
MEADEGKRVTIRFVCRYEDGTIYEYADSDTLEFVIGEGNIFPTLEKGVIGMHPGQRRIIRVSEAELKEYPFELGEAPIEPVFSAGIAGSGSGDEFYTDDDEGDALQPDNLTLTSTEENPDTGLDLLFDVEMVTVEDLDVELGEGRSHTW